MQKFMIWHGEKGFGNQLHYQWFVFIMQSLCTLQWAFYAYWKPQVDGKYFYLQCFMKVQMTLATTVQII